MEVNQLKPRKALNKAFLKVKPNRAEMEVFKGHLIELLDGANEAESEEFHKNLVRDFLKKTYYDPGHSINTKGRNDLVIHTGAKASSPVGVILEAKKPTNASEMVQAAAKGDAPAVQRRKLNVKAMHELLLYYLRERITGRNLEVKHLIITNLREWFVFDAMTFDRLFAQDKKLVQQFRDFEAGRLADTRTDFFYREVAAPFIAELEAELSYTYFDIRDYERPLRNTDKADDRKLIALYKLLSPEHLLKLPFVNDSNSLDKRFYSELLHIIGLTETKKGSKKLIERQPEGQRQTGTMLEDAIIQLDSLDKINRLERPGQYGATQEERLFNVALELSLTWINRILFLKLLEAQLLTYHKGDKSYSFLNERQLRSYDDLNGLFFQVLAKQHGDRNPDVKEAFRRVPYLNSSLFQPTNMEQETLFISNLRDDKTIPVYGQTVLKDGRGKRFDGEMKTLAYLFAFLESYDFSSEGSEEIQEENKALINASVLGLIFEKINGYKDGSFFTPGFITMYMCRETIRKAVVQKFNEEKGWDCEAPEELYDQIEDRQEANEIVNSLKICDPAVGSGHFLVSALNEMIAVKNDLRILQDRDGHRLKEYQVEVVNDELIVTDEEGELFDYKPHSKESQRVQEALFHEKQTLIENCLFGVDINPNSVKICRLRLWIELLKNAYYKNETELETLPNIDINIKCGNSLVSRFDINSDLKQALKKSKWTIDSYRVAVDTYRNAQNKEEKRKMKELIADIKSDFRSEISSNDPKVRRLQKLNGQLFQLTHQGQLFEMSKKEKAAWEKNVSKLTKQTQKLEAEIEEIKANKIYENAFEWRFEFPEVLNVDGDFMGFDVVIGNPPYAVLEKKRNTPLEPYRDILDYAKETKRYSLVEGGKQNLYRLFLKISHDIARDKTSFGYIIPLTFIGDNSLYKTRNFVFNRFADLKLHCFPQKDNISKRVFEDAKQSTLVILGKIDKNGKVVRPKRLKVFKYPYNSFLDDSEEYEAWISEIKKIDPHRNSIPVVSAKEWEVLKNIHEHPPIRSMNDIKVNRGEINQTIYRDYISSNSNLAKLVKGVQIGQYKINEVLSQGTREFFDEEAFEKNGKKNKHKNNRRIATQRITGIDERLRIVAMIIEPPAYFADSTNSIYVKDQISLEFLLGILNSKLFQWRFKKTSSNNNVSTTQLESLPFCHEPNIASKVKVVVTEIISLKKTNPSADTSDLEAQVDRLVYDLYGLTEEEVGVVEGGDQ